jgi:REP element-mobilizing transposase RayT
MRGSARTFETDLAEFNSETNHVHLPVNSPPEVALSRLVNSPKDVPSRRLRQETTASGHLVATAPMRLPPAPPHSVLPARLTCTLLVTVVFAG